MSPIRTLTSVLAFRTFLWISWHFAHFCGYSRPQTSMSKSQTHGNACTLFGLLCGDVFQTLWEIFDQEKSSCFDRSTDMPTIPLVWKWCHIYNLVLCRICVSLCWYNVWQTFKAVVQRWQKHKITGETLGIQCGTTAKHYLTLYQGKSRDILLAWIDQGTSLNWHISYDLNVKYFKEKERNSNEYIVIEFFLGLKIHRICAGVPIFAIENLNLIVSMAKPWNTRHAVSWLNSYIVPDLTSTK